MNKYLFVSVFMFLSCSVFGLESTRNEDVRLEFHEMAISVLINYEYCENKNDCSAKEILKSRRTESGFSVTSYGVSKIETIKELELCLRKLHKKYDNRFEMGYSAVMENHNVFVNKLFPPKATQLFSLWLPGK